MQAFFASLGWFVAGVALAHLSLLAGEAVRRWRAERAWRRQRLRMVAALARTASQGEGDRET